MDTYDPESGQVFKETIMPQRQNEGPWEFRCLAGRTKNSRFLARPPQHRVLKSLQDLCLAKLICNANSLLPETLEGLPEPIALRIWTAIRREWCESFHVWTAFVNAGFSERFFKHALMIRDWHKWPLIDTFSKLSSQHCAWTVDLTLANVVLYDAEFKELSRITNLQNLLVQYNRSVDGRYFDDRILKAWANRARDEGAFGHLETLSVINAPAITAHAFEHLSAFPMLTVVISAGCDAFKRQDFEKVERHGWSRFEPEGGAHSLASGYFRDTSPHYKASWLMRGPRNIRDFVESQRPSKTESLSVVPRLDVELGSFGVKGSATMPHNPLCFRRDQGLNAPTPTADAGDDVGSRKRRRRIYDSKGADFTAMLNGG